MSSVQFLLLEAPRVRVITIPDRTLFHERFSPRVPRMYERRNPNVNTERCLDMRGVACVQPPLPSKQIGGEGRLYTGYGRGRTPRKTFSFRVEIAPMHLEIILLSTSCDLFWNLNFITKCESQEPSQLNSRRELVSFADC